MKGKCILVTGGAGFIGSNLCKELIKNNKVFSIDNYSSGTSKNHIDGVFYINSDTKNIDDIEFVPDIIFHLGEYSRVEQSFDNIEKVIDYNKIGTLAVLEYCRKHNVRLIYAGSSTKFGDIGSNSSPYSWSKCSNTELINNYGQWFNLNYAIVYFYNVYGKNEISEGEYATVIAKFKKMKELGQSVQIVSPGTQKRNFTHVDDIISGLMLVGKYGKGDGYGIGSDDSFSILDIAKMLNCKYDIIPKRKGNRMTAEVVTDKIKDLGWSCKHNLVDYLS